MNEVKLEENICTTMIIGIVIAVGVMIVSCIINKKLEEVSPSFLLFSL